MFNLRIHPFFLLPVFLLGFSLTVKAQEHQGISADSAIVIYKNATENKLSYIHGKEYKPYHQPTHQNPYLKAITGRGSIYIDGRAYHNKKLIYDIKKDLVIVNPDYYKFSNLYLHFKKADVDSFTINLDENFYKFTHYRKNKCNNALLPGFYEQLYVSSKTELLIQHKVNAGKSEGLITYKYKTYRFILTHGQYHNISSKKKLFKVFPESKKALKKKIKTLSHSYKPMSNIQLIELIKFTETL